MRDPITVVYFAWVREKVGLSREEVVLPQAVQTVADLMVWLAARGPNYENAFATPHVIRSAIDHTHVKTSASLNGAKEVAFFPPVTGG